MSGVFIEEAKSDKVSNFESENSKPYCGCTFEFYTF